MVPQALFHNLKPKMVSQLDWTPRDSDVAWLQGILGMIRNKGVWAVPGTGQIYTVDHDFKVLLLVEDPNTLDSEELHEHTVIIGKILGWKVKKLDAQTQNPKPSDASPKKESRC